jgi:hypothetical protein
MSDACPDYDPKGCFNLVIACLGSCVISPIIEMERDNKYLKYFWNKVTLNEIKDRRLKFLDGKLVKMATDCSNSLAIYKIIKYAKKYNEIK